MKIAVTSTGSSLSSKVDLRFGRAAFFMIVDTETMDFTAVENEHAIAGAAGVDSAKFLIDQSVEAVLTNHCGPNAERILSAVGVKIYTGLTGTVTEAVELFICGKLTAAEGPSVQSHFGLGKHYAG